MSDDTELGASPADLVAAVSKLEGVREVDVRDGREFPGMERHNDVVNGDVIWHRWNCTGTDLEPGRYLVVPLRVADKEDTE